MYPLMLYLVVVKLIFFLISLIFFLLFSIFVSSRRIELNGTHCRDLIDLSFYLFFLFSSGFVLVYLCLKYLPRPINSWDCTKYCTMQFCIRAFIFCVLVTILEDKEYTAHFITPYRLKYIRPKKQYYYDYQKVGVLVNLWESVKKHSTF